ncbi:unnamed protein product [Dracunculus medinensis]|uniref:Very-long-chain (3R)-3-hydroxyacyl-CoA dehydratase n=1 Tax=Dracunculus medinensis TaxID=318479 RepID=A0A0N4U395_DRAME|nr:unnamed protein product [Dracunculus medinensis]
MKPVQTYLFLYNLLQFFGWSVILIKTVANLIIIRCYNSVEFELQIFQTAAILEVIHAALGFVRSPVGTTAIQVYSRVSIVWLILYKVISTRSSIGVPMLLFAWSLTEVIRYSFYALTLLKCVPQFLTWLRYSLFIALYPLGVSGELLCIFAAFNEVSIKKHFTLEMPNMFNIAFSFWWYLVFMVLLYIPAFPKLYCYMLAQRRKVLGVEASKKRE